jgi:hypothetical protein
MVIIPRHAKLLMAHPQQKHNQLGHFTPLGQEPLSSKVWGIRLPLDVDSYLETMPASERSIWLRKVICTAVREQITLESPPTH